MEKMNLSEAYLMRAKASLVDRAIEFVGMADSEGRLFYLNDAAYQMMGYGPEERPHFETIADVHANEFDKFALAVIQPAVMQNGYWSGTGYLRKKDGRPLLVQQTVFPVYDETGVMYGTAAIMKDISYEMDREKQFRENARLFQQVLDSAKIGIVLINMEAKTIEMANQHTSSLLGLPKERIVGCKCYEVLCHHNPDSCPHVLQKDQHTIVAERVIERADGKSIPIIKTGTWITLADTEYLVDTLVDISIQKDLENRLLDAKISAEAASRSKSEFLSRMSHEMRTPLTAIIGMLQLTRETVEPEKLKRAMKIIETSSEHLLSLINDILDLSKIEEGKLELTVAPFSLKDTLEKIGFIIRPKAKEKDIFFRIDMDDKLPDVFLGDGLRLSQVLINFLSNAVKFTKEQGRVTLAIEGLTIGPEAATLRFTVSDNGIGIAKEHLPKLFQPFTQTDGSISRRFGGTGLGLAISRRIINLMNAEVVVQSEPGKGSRFFFELALPQALAPSQNEGEADALDPVGLFHGKRVLIVDDLAINRMIVAELLAQTGIEAHEAENGQAALEKMIKHDYDAVLMDVQMPVMDGYEATGHIRQLEDRAKSAVPIIAMSANVFKEDVELSLQAGMNAHIGKPIDFLHTVKTMAHFILSSRDKNKTPSEGWLASGGKASEKLFDLLCKAMDGNDYQGAKELLEEISLQAREKGGLELMISYADNVWECLDQQSFQQAKMYLADLLDVYEAACLEE